MNNDDELITNEWVSANWPAEMKRLGIYLRCCDGCNPGVIYITTGGLFPCVTNLVSVKTRGDVRAFMRGTGRQCERGRVMRTMKELMKGSE
jgi:hypothetical protein